MSMSTPWKTKLCRFYLAGAPCPYRQCWFAHGNWDFRYPSGARLCQVCGLANYRGAGKCDTEGCRTSETPVGQQVPSSWTADAVHQPASSQLQEQLSQTDGSWSHQEWTPAGQQVPGSSTADSVHQPASSQLQQQWNQIHGHQEWSWHDHWWWSSTDESAWTAAEDDMPVSPPASTQELVVSIPWPVRSIVLPSLPAAPDDGHIAASSGSSEVGVSVRKRAYVANVTDEVIFTNDPGIVYKRVRLE